MSRINMVFIMMALFLVATYNMAGAAELGAAKKLTPNTGPTMEETISFIKNKFFEFISGYTRSSSSDVMDWDFNYNIDAVDIIYSNCRFDIKMNEEETMVIKDHNTSITNMSGTNKYRFYNNYTFNLNDIKSVAVGIFGNTKKSSESDIHLNGKPVVGVILKSDKKSIYNDTSGKSKGYHDVVEFPIKSEEQAKRLANAFEHAVKLCGGSVEAEKPEPF